MVGLREALCSEKILKCRSLLKAGIDFWTQEDLKPHFVFPIIPEAIISRESETMEADHFPETTEIVQLLAGHVAKKIMLRTKFNECECLMTVKNNEASMNQTAEKYLQDLWRGNLIIPSTPLEDIVNSCFTVLEYAD